MARSFDEISPVYDETRDPLDATSLDALATALRGDGVGSLVEIGVGTGRVAKPLVDRGIEVTGVDASRGMLRQARAKGLDRLVRGSAYRLPFDDRRFGGALFVHVLHLLDRPEEALREAIRISRSGVMAMVRRPSRTGPAVEPRWDEGRRLVGELLERAGYPRRWRGGPETRERELFDRLPPDAILILGEREVTEPLSKGIAAMAKRGSRHLKDVPDAVLARAIADASAQVGDRTHTYRRVDALAHWSRLPETVDPPRPETGSAGEPVVHDVR